MSIGFNCCAILAFATTIFSVTPVASAADDIEASVVKVLVTKREPDYFKPWTKAAPEKSSGSGVVIEGKRILTNAHVVMHASQVFVQMRRGGDQLNAKVKAIGPGIDLAIVELTDPERLKDVPAVPLADALPELKSHVSVYGYPAGGDDLSITDGIVSRIEFTSYNYAAGGVRIQVDAALNPGNSGGPAINEGKIVGLVFSKINEAENIGYLIPADEIREFLKHADKGRYDGNLLLLDEYQTAENEALRKFLKIPADVTGIVITKPYSDKDDYPLQQWDVITHIGKHTIDNQGYVDIRDGLRMRFLYYVAREARDDKIDLTILRDGEKKEVSVPVAPRRETVLPTLQDEYPEYFIYGPLVFEVASQEYVRALGANGLGALLVLQSPMLSRLYDKPDEPGEQLVVLATRMFPHPSIKGYDNRPLGVIEKLNGKPVKNLRGLAEMIRDSQDEFLRFEMAERSEALVFKRAEMEEATEEILSNEGIRYQSSESLKDVFEN
jgi:S1-C subfamily serine protease